MAKFNDAAKMPGGPTSGIAGEQPQGGDFLSRVNETAKNIKAVLDIAMSSRNAPAQQPAERQIMRNSDGPPVKQIEAPKQPSEIAQLMQVAIAFGYGNKSIKELIELVGPFTINQIVDVLQKAVQRGNRPNQ
jgi:hypothetical protein